MTSKSSGRPVDPIVKTASITILACLLIIGLGVGCGDDSSQPERQLVKEPFVADGFLPGSLPGIALQRFTVKTSEDDLREYVGSAVETYYDYNLVGLVAALYSFGESTVSVEIGQFQTQLNAYGFYSLTRPDGVDVLSLGDEGYEHGNSLNFVQDRFTVTLSAFQDTLDVSDAARRLAVTISMDIGKPGDLPEEFARFPVEHRIQGTFRFFPKSFLEIALLDSVLTALYAVNGDTVTLFYGPDRSGSAYIALKEAAKASEVEAMLPESISGFDADYVTVLKHAEYGQVVAGLVNQRLAGVVGYTEGSEKVLHALMARLADSE